MSSASEYVKFGGCLGFSTVFLLVLVKNRDVSAALLDASIACIIMAMIFRQAHAYTSKLEKRIREKKRAERAKESQSEGENEYDSLTDGRAES